MSAADRFLRLALKRVVGEVLNFPLCVSTAFESTLLSSCDALARTNEVVAAILAPSTSASTLDTVIYITAGIWVIRIDCDTGARLGRAGGRAKATVV